MTEQTARPFRVLTHPDDLLRQERAARAARIDKLGVDRTRHREKLVLRDWSPEADRGEQRVEGYRLDATAEDKIDAWRQLFALPRIQADRAARE
jgi:hypothetical protein